MPAPPPSLVTFMKSSKSSSSSNKNKNTSGGIPEGVSGCVGGIAGFNNWPKREQYTDKDRAAAVILGDTDIKTTLEKQLKSDRGRYVLPKESPAQVYLAQAEFEMRIGGWTIAHQLLQKVHKHFGHPHRIRQLTRISANETLSAPSGVNLISPMALFPIFYSCRVHQFYGMFVAFGGQSL